MKTDKILLNNLHFGNNLVNFVYGYNLKKILRLSKKTIESNKWF